MLGYTRRVTDGGRVLGVNVAAGVAYLSVVERPDVLILDTTPKIKPPNNVPDDWKQLQVFGARVVEEAKAVRAGLVVFAQTGKSNQWVYSQAYTRASLVVVAGIALSDAGIEARIVPQQTAAAFLGVKFGKLLEKQLAAKLGIPRRDVIHWKERSAGLAVALYVARESRS